MDKKLWGKLLLGIPKHLLKVSILIVIGSFIVPRDNPCQYTGVTGRRIWSPTDFEKHPDP